MTTSDHPSGAATFASRGARLHAMVAAQMRDRGLRILLFVAHFGVARVIIYCLPLAIAALAPASVYGMIEFAQSMSLLGVALLIGAPFVGVSQRYLINKEPLAVDVVAVAVVLTSALALAAGSAAWALGAQPFVTVSLLALSLASVHNSFATVFRTLAWRNVTVWSDGFAFIIAFVIVLVSFALTGGVDTQAIGIGYAAFAVLALAGGLMVLARSRRPGLASRARRMIHFGAPVLVSSSFAVWQSGAGRILAGMLVPAQLPAYALAFRIVGLSLGLHQLAGVALFSRMYAGRTRRVDRLLSSLLAGVVLILFGILAASYLFIREGTFAALHGEGYRLFFAVLPITAVQLLFWIGNAMFEMRVTRFGLAKKTILPSMAINGVALAGLFAARSFTPITLPAICWLVTAQSAAFFFYSAWLLYRRGVPHRLLAAVGAGGGGLLTLAALLLSNLA